MWVYHDFFANRIRIHVSWSGPGSIYLVLILCHLFLALVIPVRYTKSIFFLSTCINYPYPVLTLVDCSNQT